MKFFKQTKETKRKISFFMALAMIISLLPVSPVVKAADNVKDCNVYIVNNCSTYVDVSDISTGNAIKEAKEGEATTSAVIKVTSKGNYKIKAVSSSSIDITESGGELGGITVANNSGEVVTGVAVTVKKVTGTVTGNVTSCAISSSSVNTVSIEKAGNGDSEYAKITVNGVKDGNVEITLSYKNTAEEENTKPTVEFDKKGLTGATVTASCGENNLDIAKITPVTSGSIVGITIKPDGKNIFTDGPVVMVDDKRVDVKEANNVYTASTGKITKNTKIVISGTASEVTDATKFSVTFDKTGLKNADAEATFDKKTFTKGELAASDEVSITVKPETGYVFTDTNKPAIEADGAVTSGALQDDGSYNATVTGFTKSTTIKVSGEPVKSSLEADNSNSKDNVGEAKLEVNAATLEKNKDKLIAAFGPASKAAIEKALEDGGKISVSLTVTASSITADDKKIVSDAKLGVTEADLDKGVVLDIKLTAKCHDKGGEVIATSDVKELTEDVTITMSVKGLIKEEVQKGYTRTYYIIRIHDGKAEKIECKHDEENGIISFSSKLFSTYILMYDDKKDNTDDNKPSTPGGSSGIGSYIPSGATATPAPSATPSATPDASATPGVSAEPGASAVPSASPSNTTEPGESSKPDTTAAPGGSDDDKNTGSTSVKVGKKVTVNSSKYKVTSVSGTRAVQFTSGKKNAKNVVIPATVKISGKNYKVTSIANNAFKNNKKLKKVTIGVNVNKIGKAAFKGCKNLKSIVIKTKKLTAKKVGANAFKGINKKATFKVPKNKVKAYKKIVKAKGAAKTVKVKK